VSHRGCAEGINPLCPACVQDGLIHGVGSEGGVRWSVDLGRPLVSSYQRHSPLATSSGKPRSDDVHPPRVSGHEERMLWRLVGSGGLIPIGG
jgi:hypothetical protein